ncbi:CLUMA_CG013792, isoform A [Clunio marinus]|uniref:CLUMA_CG013792, isoform A n=1 Tax=Clunio marinus TaxID=568069 RepID=A0A1J1IJX2_9DIPT|nr:CLUMA_CG013792, isoform A [Clunio marinus]
MKAEENIKLFNILKVKINDDYGVFRLKFCIIVAVNASLLRQQFGKFLTTELCKYKDSMMEFEHQQEYN